MTTLTQIAVPFHNAELYLVEHDGQPYTPMKPIVDGMGLAWQTQHRKLTQGYNQNGDTLQREGQNDHTPNRWGVSIIEIPTLSGIQEMLCIPLRKLFAWLMTISPNKVKPELRDTVIMYQNECDDVLWDYWTKGQAINKRHTITPEQKTTLQKIVDHKVNGNQGLRAQVWTRHNRHFNINSYHELLAVHFDDAVNYLNEMDVKVKGEQSSTFDLLEFDTVNKIMDHYGALYQEIERLGGNLPDYPLFDKEAIVRATITKMIDSSKMLLKLNMNTGRPEVSFIPEGSWITTNDNIADLVGNPHGPNKNTLPSIISAAAERLK